MGSSVEPWFVLRTRCHHENAVQNELERKQIVSFLPMRTIVRRRSERRSLLRVPLFPGYVFVQPRADEFHEIRCIRGSCGFVLAGARPAPMSEQELEAVRIIVGSGAALVVNPQLIPGQRVAVVAGPFMGVQGVLTRVKCQQRLVINAHLLNTSVSVEVDVDKIIVL
ncbi:transcription termination/antitermination protein NusG [Steroidobacter gossypii]|uniref:transcription termination/antitermination protein NusG n=1 Tax=Steroidobacter gossypii TaxID=2805490 RepID=UPI001E492F6F|nr:UpxY family transcription antiterminator [Steroidobacter gossypii]